MKSLTLIDIYPLPCILDKKGPASNDPAQEGPAKDDPMTESSVDTVAILPSLVGILLLGGVAAGVSIYLALKWAARRRRQRETAEGEWTLRE